MQTLHNSYALFMHEANQNTSFYYFFSDGAILSIVSSM
jgi:hypothetical protein